MHVLGHPKASVRMHGNRRVLLDRLQACWERGPRWGVAIGAILGQAHKRVGDQRRRQCLQSHRSGTCLVGSEIPQACCQQLVLPKHPHGPGGSISITGQPWAQGQGLRHNSHHTLLASGFHPQRHAGPASAIGKGLGVLEVGGGQRCVPEMLGREPLAVGSRWCRLLLLLLLLLLLPKQLCDHLLDMGILLSVLGR